GVILLLASLMGQYGWLRRQIRSGIQGNGWPAVVRVGFRNATYRAGRSILCIALIASAAFVIVAVESFKQSSDGRQVHGKSGSGGFPLLAESQLPLYHDPNTPDGREALGLIAQKGFDPERIVFTPFRVRPGDDASCLNLYQPKDPKVLAPNDGFLSSG